ncbi:taste receptor type 1 member 3 [Genypterus blacodes]|uniref:taste receptor type 1 member 3 n=1 Tax=Genypterus blacodes TaxID=154954 RepID=UPI003F75E94D
MAEALGLLVLCCVFRLSCSQSSPEWFQNISTDVFSMSGDILLGGLFQINQFTDSLSPLKPGNIRCESTYDYGLGLALVMKYTVDEINANQALLPGIRLGYEIFDTCLQSAVIVDPTLLFLTEKSNRELDVECDYTNYETRVAAVIGPFSSEMVSVIGKLLGFFLMPQISYGATSDKFSDKSLYPSFLRTVPSDKWQAEVMVELLKAFNWNWVAVVGSEDEYGQQGQREFSKIAEKESICVAYQGLIPVYGEAESAVQTIIRNIQTTNVGVVVVFSLPGPARVLFSEVIRQNVTAVWIASTGWSINYQLTTLPDIHTVGTIIGFTDRVQTLDLLTAYTQELLTKLGQEGMGTAAGPHSPCPQCWNLSPANISLVTNHAVQHTAFSVYAAIYSVAQALHNMLGCNATACVWGPESKIYPWQLLDVLKSVSLDIDGTHLAYDSDGNPNIGYNLIEWVWKDSDLRFIEVGNFHKYFTINKTLLKWHTEDSKVPKSTCSASCAAGQVRRVKGFHSCCFDCIDCLPGTYQAKKDDIRCTQCPKGKWSLISSTNCTEPTFEFLSWDKSESVEIMVAGVVLLVFQGSVGVMFVKHRGTPLISASGGVLSFVALLSLMAGCLSLLLFLGPPGDLVCGLQVPLTSAFQTVALSIFMVISLRIFFVTEFPEKAASYLHMSGPLTWLFVLACCIVQAGFCGWFVQTGPSLSEHVAKMEINFVRSFLTCPMEPLIGFGLIQGLNAGMALISFMCTFMAVKPVHQYNLARDITFSCLIYCVIWVTFIPIYTGLTDMQRSIVHISFSLASNLGLVAAYYFPKCHLLRKKPELNTPEHFCTFLEGSPPTPQEEPQAEPQAGQ